MSVSLTQIIHILVFCVFITNQGKHMVFVILKLAYFTKQSGFQLHPIFGKR